MTFKDSCGLNVEMSFYLFVLILWLFIFLFCLYLEMYLTFLLVFFPTCLLSALDTGSKKIS